MRNLKILCILGMLMMIPMVASGEDFWGSVGDLVSGKDGTKYVGLEVEKKVKKFDNGIFGLDDIRWVNHWRVEVGQLNEGQDREYEVETFLKLEF